MVSQLAVMNAVAAAGLELKTIAANSASGGADAALALVARVDAICQLPGNLTAAAFPSIAQVARRARSAGVRVPEQPGPRRRRGGRVARLLRERPRAGAVAARVMRGESPATHAVHRFSGTKLIVNLAAAREVGLPFHQRSSPGPISRRQVAPMEIARKLTGDASKWAGRGPLDGYWGDHLDSALGRSLARWQSPHPRGLLAGELLLSSPASACSCASQGVGASRRFDVVEPVASPSPWCA